MAHDSTRFVLLVGWADGRSEQIEIPAAPGRSCALLEVGPRDQEPCATVPVYANDAPTLAEVIVHGAEIPSMIACPAPAQEPCPDCGTPMVEVIPPRTRKSLPMCPQCHPVTCHDGTIVEPLGPFSCSGERLVPSEVIVNDGYGAFPLPIKVDLDVTPLAVGFDLRVQGTAIAVPADCQSVRFVDRDGEECTVGGSRVAVVAALIEAGYRVASLTFPPPGSSENMPTNGVALDPWDVALIAIAAQRRRALSTLALVEAAIQRARAMPRVEAVRVLDAAGSLEHDLGLADVDCACDVLLEEAFGDIHDPDGEVIPLEEAERFIRRTGGLE